MRIYGRTLPPMNRPLWLIFAPAIFLLLWSAGFAIAKLGLEHAAPVTLLALRYVLVLVVLAPFALVLMAGLRERMTLDSTPDLVKGAALTLLLAGILSLCFMGFSGLGG